MNKYADEIKARITMRDVADRYGLTVSRSGFACCPFHNENTPSMKIYDGDRGFHCFGCGKSGDVIRFVQDYFNISFIEAVGKLDTDFSLGIIRDEKLTKRQRLASAKEDFLRKRAEDARRAQETAILRDYDEALTKYTTYDKNRRKYAPRTPDEIPHPLFIEAIKNIEQAKAEFEYQTERLNNYENRHRHDSRI